MCDGGTPERKKDTKMFNLKSNVTDEAGICLYIFVNQIEILLYYRENFFNVKMKCADFFFFVR